MTVPHTPAPPSSGLRSIATNAGYLFVARFVTHAVRAVYVIVLARAFGPELYGLLAYGQSWVGVFLPLTVLGFGVVLAREVGLDPAHGREDAAHMFVVRGALTLAAAALCIGIGWAVNTDPAVRMLIGILVLALIGRAAATLAEDVFAAFEAAHLTFRQEALFRPAEVGLGLAVLAFGGGVIEIAAVHAAMHVVQGARGAILARRYVTLLREGLAWRSLKSLLLKGAMAGAAGLLSVWILQGPLVLYAQIAADKASIGNLALVLQALVLCCTLPWAIGRAALPVLSRASARPDGGQARFADFMLRLAFVFAGASALAGFALGPPLMAWVFGAGYAEAGALLGPALWLLLPLTAATALNPLLMVRESYGAAALAALAGAAAMTISVPLLAMPMGPLGAISGAIAGAGLWAVCLLVLVAQGDSVAIHLAILRPAIALTLAVFAYLAMADTSAGPVACLLVAWLVLLSATGGLCMTPAERRATAAFAAKLRAKIIGRLH